MPDQYESGTPNTIGFAGLGAGVNFVLEQTVEAIRTKERKLTSCFLEPLKALSDQVILYGPGDVTRQTAVISFNVKNIISSDAALYFEENFGILCRPGLHCAPSAHHTIGTFPQGAIRFSFGFFNTEQDVERACEAVLKLLKG